MFELGPAGIPFRGAREPCPADLGFLPRLKLTSRYARLADMEPRYTIGRLARAGGVATSTVRFYERSRLLRPDGRTEGNYRVYGPPALERLRFIRAAQANGFTLQDVVTLLNFRDGTTAPCREVQSLIEDRLADLKKRLKEMRHVQAELRTSLDLCRRAEKLGRCQVMDTLKVAASSLPSGTPRRSGSKKV